MIGCLRLDDPAPAIAYLRQDVLANLTLLIEIETDMPPGPREIWIAHREYRTILGVMTASDRAASTENAEFGAEIRADSAEAASALMRCLKRNQWYRFVAAATEFRQALVEQLSETGAMCETTSLALARDDFCVREVAAEVRQLTLADKELADRFPDPPGEYEPPLSRFLEWADNAPEHQVVFGVLVEGEITSYVQFGWVLDDIWDVSMIRTSEDRRGQGLAAAVLSHASRYLLEHNRVPYYSGVRPDNIASYRTARAVGYREVFRLSFCGGKVRQGVA